MRAAAGYIIVHRWVERAVRRLSGTHHQRNHLAPWVMPNKVA
jgi:hypothetical protein